VAAEQNPSELDNRQYLTKRELCQKRGLSAPTIQRYKERGLIRYIQPAGRGGRVLFPPDALEGIVRSPQSSSPIPIPPSKVSTGLRGPRPQWMRARKESKS
jgi:hypothetical protein